MALTTAHRAMIEERIEKINAAIDRLLGGFREAEFNGRRYREHDLSDLERLLALNEEKLARDDAGGMRVRTVVPNG